SFSTTQSCATDTCLDQSVEWILERPAFFLPFGFQILPLADFGQTGFSNGTEVSGGRPATIGGFQGGDVYNVQLQDDSGSYYLDCTGQFGPPDQLLLTSDPNSCPAIGPSRSGGFRTTWDASF
ncbi:MAG TPA: G1 family glutamic endopeptidase, partial [Acidimicrobiales bacterium]|nr:G1 family glutamic endopeptidase [Acidimicrobiales bacterium]